MRPSSQTNRRAERAEIERKTKEFLDRGGKIFDARPGQSGHDNLPNWRDIVGDVSAIPNFDPNRKTKRNR